MIAKMLMRFLSPQTITTRPSGFRAIRLRAVIKTESDYDPAVVSSAGAQGLMQLMPDTARLMGVTS